MITDEQIEAALKEFQEVLDEACAEHQYELVLDCVKRALEAAERAAWRPIEAMIDGDGKVLAAHKCWDGSWVYETWDREALRAERGKIAAGMFKSAPHMIYYPEAARPSLSPQPRTRESEDG